MMSKCLFSVLGGLFITLVFMGCNQPNETTNQQHLSGQAAFPKFLVGVWQITEGEYKGKWAFKFEPDGSISKMTHLLADDVNMEEGGSQLKGREGAYAIFVMGPYSVNYTAETRELNVRVVLDFFRMEMPIGVVEGASDDYFKGQISKDGKTWKANWIGYTPLEGADLPDPNTIEANPIPLVFTKIDVK